MLLASAMVPFPTSAPWRHIVGVAYGLLGLAALVGLAALAWWGPQWVVSRENLQGLPTAADRLKHESDVRGSFLALIGGFGLLLTLGSTTASLLLQRRGQMTERFTRAVEQLGSEKPEVRLGGVYALQQIAKDSDDLNQPICEVLVLFVQEHSPMGEPVTRDVAVAWEALHEAPLKNRAHHVPGWV